MIAAIVVTYNRLGLLKRTIDCLRNTHGLDAIIVVNNGCTDGTKEWLQQQCDIISIHQENEGGSGGFYTGIEHAYQAGYDLFWCMDDDVFPRPDCLKKLLEADTEGVGILCPRRIQDAKIFVNECVELNLSNPFYSLHKNKLSSDVRFPVPIEGMVFEGPLIKREVVKEIGYPNKDLFIFYDDTDYSYRASSAHFKILYVPDALLDKERFFTHENWTVKRRQKKWKQLYQVRNAAYFNHHYGKNIWIRHVRPFHIVFGYLFIIFFCAPFTKAYDLKDLKSYWKAYRLGIQELLGKLSL